MIKTKTILEAKIGDRVYQMECEPSSTLGEVYDALSIMKNHIIERMQQIDKKQESNEIIVEG